LRAGRDPNLGVAQMIDAFRRRTGVGAVLNTSFNESEPIVDTPEQALDCFRRTDMDALCLGRYVLVKAQSRWRRGAVMGWQSVAALAATI
jgi:predicted NodU family carbamoyl transferase